MQPLLFALLATVAFGDATSAASENATVSIDSTLTYCLLPDFEGNVPRTLLTQTPPTAPLRLYLQLQKKLCLFLMIKNSLI
jgi:hypothetical protein